MVVRYASIRCTIVNVLQSCRVRWRGERNWEPTFSTSKHWIMSALPPKADIARRPLACPLSAISGCEQSQQKVPLFDHLVGAGEHSRRDIEAERLGRFEVYD